MILSQPFLAVSYTHLEVIQPDTGMLACRDVGDGKMPKEEVLLSLIHI